MQNGDPSNQGKNRRFGLPTIAIFEPLMENRSIAPLSDPEIQEFLSFLYDSGALQFGSFTTKSGRQTPYFINMGNLAEADQLARLGAYYATAIHRFFDGEVTNLFGPAYKGIPLATTSALHLFREYGHNVSVSFNRKEEKSHGEQGWLMGHAYDPKEKARVVIVEDVTTAGTSIRDCYPKIQEAVKPTGKVLGLVVAVDRLERGVGEQSALVELAETFGIKTVALCNFFRLRRIQQASVKEQIFYRTRTLLWDAPWILSTENKSRSSGYSWECPTLAVYR